MANYTEVQLILAANEARKLQQRAKLETRSLSDQARHYIRQALGLTEDNCSEVPVNENRSASLSHGERVAVGS